MKTFEFDYAGVKTVCLAKSEMQDGHYYHGDCRNAILDLARWDVANEEFVYIRQKFGSLFTEPIKHPEDEGHYDVFSVQYEVKEPPFIIPLGYEKLDRDAVRKVMKNG